LGCFFMLRLQGNIKLIMGTGKTGHATRRLSLLDAFMIQKTRAYNEPRRKGIPRGRPMGLATPKFGAAVYCLKSTPLKEIASAVPVSYGLLRKWRTEERFLSLVTMLSTEFVDRALVKHLEKRAEVQRGLDDAYSEKTMADIAGTPPPQLGWAEFRDLSSYSEDLLSLLGARLRKTQAELLERAGPRWDAEDFRQRRDGLYRALQCEGLLALVRARFLILKKDPRKYENPGSSCAEARRDAEYERSLTMLGDGPLGQDERKRMIAVLHRLRGRFTLVELEDIGVGAKEERREPTGGSYQKPIGRHLL
jgi:hypothetical protein